MKLTAIILRFDCVRLSLLFPAAVSYSLFFRVFISLRPVELRSLDLPVGCSRLACGAGLSLALKCFASTGRREYPSCIYFVRSCSPLSTPYRYHGNFLERIYEYDAEVLYFSVHGYLSATIAIVNMDVGRYARFRNTH